MALYNKHTTYEENYLYEQVCVKSIAKYRISKVLRNIYISYYEVRIHSFVIACIVTFNIATHTED
jgi:hypothetical protein